MHHETIASTLVGLAAVIAATFLDEVGGLLPELGGGTIIISGAVWAARITTRAQRDAYATRSEADAAAIDRLQDDLDAARAEIVRLREEQT